MNRSMASKHAKARKCAVAEMLEIAYNESCATKICPQCDSVRWNLRTNSWKRMLSSFARVK